MTQPARSGAPVLYISYDGILEPLGDSQVLSYLRRLARTREIFLVSFEKPEDRGIPTRVAACAAELRETGITWVPLRYHRYPSVPATAFDIMVGFFTCAWIAIRHRVHIIHARSYVSAVIAWPLKRLLRRRFVFDMRGFWADQRVETGSWQQGAVVYRIVKWFEKRFLLDADVVVTLTHAAVEAIHGLPYLRDRTPRLETITTCADLERFRPTPSPRHSSGSITIGFVGAVSVSYRLDDMIECFQIIQSRRPGARLCIFNRYDHSLLQQRLTAMGVDRSAVSIKSIEHSQIAGEIASLDAAIFLLKTFPSLKGSAPTKLGELLGCGVPCLSNSGIGDYDRILRSEKVGVVLESFSRSAKESAVTQLLNLTAQPDIRHRCRAAAERHFSLLAGVEAYARLYESLEGRPVPTAFASRAAATAAGIPAKLIKGL